MNLNEIEYLNDIIRKKGQMILDKDLTEFQFSCPICGNMGFVGGIDGAILHKGERPECNVCGYRGINLFKNRNGDEI